VLGKKNRRPLVGRTTHSTGTGVILSKKWEERRKASPDLFGGWGVKKAVNSYIAIKVRFKGRKKIKRGKEGTQRGGKGKESSNASCGQEVRKRIGIMSAHQKIVLGGRSSVRKNGGVEGGKDVGGR